MFEFYETFTKSVSGHNQQPNQFKYGAPPKKNLRWSKMGGAGVDMTAVKESMFFCGPLPLVIVHKYLAMV